MRGSLTRFKEGVLEGLSSLETLNLSPKSLADYLKGHKFTKGRIVNPDGSVTTVFKLDTSASVYNDVKVIANPSGGLDIFINGTYHKSFSDIEPLCQYVNQKIFRTVYEPKLEKPEFPSKSGEE